MTLYGWDASHFDGPLSLAILQRARSEGISFFTHKIGEGLQDTEGSLDDRALAFARDAGIPFVGGYVIPRTNATPAAQVARWVQLADAGEPWWRTFPGWFWQVDLERWSYDNVPASVGVVCARLLRAATGRVVVLYASRGQYGDSLTGWNGPLWNANYNAGPAYPGDGWLPGWAPYSGQAPAILQFTSSAVIAGLTTCDKNAFRGGLDDFRTMIGGTEMAADSEGALVAYSRLDTLRGGHDFVQDDQTSVAAAYRGDGQPLADFRGLWAKLAGIVRDNAGATVTLTADDRAAIVAGLVAELGPKVDAVAGKLDRVLAALVSVGEVLNPEP